MNNSEPTEITDLILEHQTDRAYLVSQGDIKCWLPKSQVEHIEVDSQDKKKIISLSIPVWLAEKNGLS